MNNFVVYAYCRKDGTFYYIGKGKPNRPYQRRGKKGINPPGDRNRIIILHSGLPEETSLDYEKKLILFYGRKDLGTGLLKNLTDGGEGTCGWIPSEEYRKNRSVQTRELHAKNKDADGKSKIGKKAAQTMNKAKHSERDEFGRSLAGKSSNFAKHARPIKVTKIDTGETFEFTNSVDAGLALGLIPRSLRKVASGERNSLYGYLVEFTDPS